MKVFYDTEFFVDGYTIHPISIGLVREDGAELYLEYEFDTLMVPADHFVYAQVLPKLTGHQTPIEVLRALIYKFCGDTPEFWADYAAYDHVVLSSTFGMLEQWPTTWDFWTNDIQQASLAVGYDRLLPIPPTTGVHNALVDARNVRDRYYVIQERNSE